MNRPLLILGEALMDCVTQADGSLLPLMGGSPYNLARAAARQGVTVAYLPPFSRDVFGQRLKAQAMADGVLPLSADSACPTALAVVTLREGQPSYSFYREGVADRDHTPQGVLALLDTPPVGILHTGSLALVPPEHHKTLAVMREARERGWRISLDINLRPALAPDLATYRDAVLEGMALADWLKASDEDLALLGLGTGPATLANADTWHQQLRHTTRADHIALTFGAAGACLWVGSHSARATPPAVQVVDTVGAGDTFWGNCLADWIAHPEAPAQRVATTLARAVASAAINCGRAGCQPPTRAELPVETIM